MSSLSAVPRSRVRRRTLQCLLPFALFGLLAGCQHNASLLEAQQAFREGNLVLAKTSIQSYREADGDGRDRLIAYIEEGSILRANGEIEASMAAFDMADSFVEEFDQMADFSLSKETTALFTNLNFIPYRGTHYDRIMLSVYRAMNFLALGQPDSARVELFRVYERQQIAVEDNAKRIEKAQAEAQAANQEQESSKRYDVERARKDPTFQASLDAAYAKLDQFDAYEAYVNPYAEFFQALYFIANPADANDRERGRVSMERVFGMVPENVYIEQDLALATQVSRGGEVPALTYILFETGSAPYRDEIRIDIPLFLVNNEVDYVGAAFPELDTVDNFATSLRVSADGQVFDTSLLADVDSIVIQEFRNELPLIVTKTLIASGTKALAAYLANQAVKDQDPWVALATRIATATYQVSQNQADLRTWATLPKQVQYARLPTPESGLILISTAGTPQPVPVSVDAKGVNVVLVRSVNTFSPLKISQFNLVPGATWQTTTVSYSPLAP
ncbi:MAG: COG3014 family protein [Opitutales bacterium]